MSDPDLATGSILGAGLTDPAATRVYPPLPFAERRRGFSEGTPEPPAARVRHGRRAGPLSQSRAPPRPRSPARQRAARRRWQGTSSGSGNRNGTTRAGTPSAPTWMSLGRRRRPPRVPSTHRGARWGRGDLRRLPRPQPHGFDPLDTAARSDPQLVLVVACDAQLVAEAGPRKSRLGDAPQVLTPAARLREPVHHPPRVSEKVEVQLAIFRIELSDVLVREGANAAG